MCVKDNIDIIVVNETQLDDSFTRRQQFCGVMIIVREDIPCREIRYDNFGYNLEGIFLEISNRKHKWLLFGGYCNTK